MDKLEQQINSKSDAKDEPLTDFQSIIDDLKENLNDKIKNLEESVAEIHLRNLETPVGKQPPPSDLSHALSATRAIVPNFGSPSLHSS